jgi:hypothetical protein
MFGLQHVSSAQPWKKWAKEPPRVPPSACQATRSARMAKRSHVSSTTCQGSFVKHEVGSESTQSVSSEAPRKPQADCQAPTSDRMAKMSHVWPTVCLSFSFMHEMDSGSTQSAYGQLPGTKKCQNGQNGSCLAHSNSHMLSHA